MAGRGLAPSEDPAHPALRRGAGAGGTYDGSGTYDSNGIRLQWWLLRRNYYYDSKL